MRVFVAIDLPEEVKNELYRIQKLINPSLAKIKWVPKKNLHLTLKFLGEVDDIDDIHQKMSKIKFEPFEVNLKNFGAFPSWENINVFWVDMEPHKEIINLQQKVDAELFNFSNKYQKFSPHLTLGRVKSIKKEKEFFKVIKSIKINPIKFEVDEFQIMESKLSKDGSKYITLKKYKS